MKTDAKEQAVSERMINMMKAAVLTGPRNFEFRDIEIPEPGPNEVRIKLEGCGLCSSFIPLWKGKEWVVYPMDPGAPGYEGWGTIDAVGDDVQNLKQGNRVVFLGIQNFAEYTIAKAGEVEILPHELDGQPFPGESVAHALHVFSKSKIEKGCTVAIVGIGYLGAILIQLAANAGAHVIAISKRRFLLDAALSLGAEEAVLYDDFTGVIEQVRTLTNGKYCDTVIEVSGKQETLDLAGEIVAANGKLIISGTHMGNRLINMQLWIKRGLEVVLTFLRDPQSKMKHMQNAIDAVSAGEIKVGSLCTHSFNFKEIGDAFETLTERPDNMIKVFVNFNKED